MSDNEILKKYDKYVSNEKNGQIPSNGDGESDFTDLLGRISGKVKDLQSEIDDHDRIKNRKE